MALEVRDPNTGKLKPWVWISGAGLGAAGVFFLLARDSASSGGGGDGTTSGGGGGGGSIGLGDAGTGGVDTSGETITDIQSTIGDILDRLDNLQPGPPGPQGPAGPTGPQGPAGPTGGTTKPTTPTTPNTVTPIIGYSLSITQKTPLYSATGVHIGGISKGTYTTKRVKVNNLWHYVITSGPRTGQYFLAEPWFKTTPIYAKPPAPTSVTTH